jgi:hypothetical protein
VKPSSRLSLAASAAAVLAAMPVLAEMRPARFDQIADATSACLSATILKGVDASKLAASGWKSGSISQNGKAVASALSFYGKEKNNAVLLVSDGKCVVQARLKSKKEMEAAKTFLLAEIKPDKVLQLPDGAFLFKSAHALVIRPGGTANRPAINIITTFMEPQPK